MLMLTGFLNFGNSQAHLPRIRWADAVWRRGWLLQKKKKKGLFSHDVLINKNLQQKSDDCLSRDVGREHTLGQI